MSMKKCTPVAQPFHGFFNSELNGRIRKAKKLAKKLYGKRPPSPFQLYIRHAMGRR